MPPSLSCIGLHCRAVACGGLPQCSLTVNLRISKEHMLPTFSAQKHDVSLAAEHRSALQKPDAATIAMVG